jgi:DNA-binding CsgD family transcriptional regulator
MVCGGWLREIELQKVFSMSPNEAKYYSMYDHGLTMARIAELDNVSIHTVGATLQRARDKMKKTRGETKQVIIIKGKHENEATAIKEHAMEVVLRFVTKILGVNMYSGAYVFLVRGMDPAQQGDLKWMLDNVFRKVDIYGANSAADVQKKADRLEEVYTEALGSEPCKVGLSTITYFLDQMYMQYEILEE